MESETSYNTPIFDKDVKYCDCEDCNGSGVVIEYIEDVWRHEPCPRCEGTGQLEIK
jgi:DnaJ-class molecular chaperone